VAARRPITVVLTSHWLSLAGTVVVTTAGFLWIFALAVQARGAVDNPYTGIVLFLLLPFLFFAGLAMIPIGALLGRRRIAAGLAGPPLDRTAAFRRLALFLGVTTAANVIIGSQLTYRAVEHMETTQFCGESCHVMRPQLRAHVAAPHASVPCVDCHVSPGARGWAKSKLDGTRQLLEVARGSYPRPVPPGLSTGRLVDSEESCEGCHSRIPSRAVRVRAIPTHADDQTGTLTWTVLAMKVSGGVNGGIHGAHMGPGVVIRFATPDPQRKSIPWVELTRPGSAPAIYLAKGADAAATAALPRHVMQCVDCHNRPAHTFELPERAVDDAMIAGEIPSSLPFVRKNGVALLRMTYADEMAARSGIDAELRRMYPTGNPDDVAKTSAALAAIWSRNVFPDLHVTWGSYPSNLGHSDETPGCFRCHDGDHATVDGKATIGQDCATCHEPIAVDEPNPAILGTLGLASGT
jgi:hypothetical protein